MGAATCPWRLIEMKGKVLCGVCVDEMGGPLSCQSAFCGLLRDEESEHYRVTSVATAASGRGCLGYLAAPAALTVRNCLIKKSDKRKVFGKFNDRPTDGGRPNPRGSLEGVPQSTGRFRWPECPSWPHLNRAVYMLKIILGPRPNA